VLRVCLNPLPPSDAVRKQEKNILEELFSSVLSCFKKYQPSENQKLNNLGIFQSSKLCKREKSFEFLLSKISLKYFGLLWVERFPTEHY